MADSSFQKVGLHLDLKIQVMPYPALLKVAREAAAAGFNTLMLEWEGSYPFREHAIISNQYAYTREEIVDFIAACSELGLDVIPLQQCFGHVEYILRHERYAALRESESDLCQLCPSRAQEAALTVFSEIFRDLAETHPSPYLHIGGDETYLLGHCPDCQAKAGEQGASRLYVDYFKKIARQVVALGKRPMLWADMLLKHPEAVKDMPPETVFIDWNYGWAFDRFGDISAIREHGFELWGAPALRSAPDSHSLTCWKRHFENLRDYVPFARSKGCAGIILTSWSTSGVYGYLWDKWGDLQEMHTIRRVYPLAGFRVLLAAFAEAVRKPLDPEAFLTRYARERFGLDEEAAGKLWAAFTAEQAVVEPGTEIAPVLKLAREARDTLRGLRPERNADEFAHYRLMFDLRVHYLRFKQLEAEIQSPQFTAERIPAMRDALDRLIEESRHLELRFSSLNQENLYPEGVLEESEYRTGKLRHLHARLSRSGRLPFTTLETALEISA